MRIPQITFLRRCRKPALYLGMMVLVLFAAGLSGCANGVFYQPDRAWRATPDTRGVAVEAVELTTSDDVALSAWRLSVLEGDPKAVVLHFHGNAQNMSTHVQFAEWLTRTGGEVWVFDYRGYGRSEGTPSRKGLVRDGVAALAAAGNRAEALEVPLVVWGQSLGGTVALQAIRHSDVKVDRLLVDSTFVSHSQIAGEKIKQMPWFLRWLGLLRPFLITRGYDAAGALKDWESAEGIPLLLIHGTADRVIPAHHSRQLFQRTPSGTGLWMVEGAGHCDAVLRFPGVVQPEIRAFLLEGRLPKDAEVKP